MWDDAESTLTDGPASGRLSELLRLVSLPLALADLLLVLAVIFSR